MAQGFQKVHVGQSMGAGFPAHIYNALIDLINAQRRGRLNRPANWVDTIRSAGIVQIQNNSGAVRARGEILGIDSPLILPSADANEFADALRLIGVEPAAEHVPDRFAILREPIEDGKIGLATVSGVCQVIVSVTDEIHNYAACYPATYAGLYSHPYGGARILWRESGTGVKYAIVRMGEAPKTGIVSVGGSGCGAASPYYGNIYTGNLLGWNSSTYSFDIGETVWIVPTNQCDASTFPLKASDQYPAIHLGRFNLLGDIREIYAIRSEDDDGKVRVQAADARDYLKDQFRDLVSDGTYHDGDVIVSVEPNDVGGGDLKLRGFLDSENYNSSEVQVLAHDAGGAALRWETVEEVTVITDLRLYSTGLQKKTATFKVIDKVENDWADCIDTTECM